MNEEDEYLLARWKRMHQEKASKRMQALFDVTRSRVSHINKEAKLSSVQRKLLTVYFGLSPALRDAFFPELKS